MYPVGASTLPLPLASAVVVVANCLYRSASALGGGAGGTQQGSRQGRSQGAADHSSDRSNTMSGWAAVRRSTSGASGGANGGTNASSGVRSSGGRVDRLMRPTTSSQRRARPPRYY
jgi:hypothetical protein